jgi:hypothetical protein
MTMRKRPILVSIVIVVGLATLTLMSGSHVRAQTERSRQLTGTWIVTVSPDLPPGVPPLTFTEFLTFDAGGGLTETNTILHPQSAASPLLPPPATGLTGSDGHGVWKNVPGEHNYAYTFQKLLFAGPVVDPVWGPILFIGQHVGRFSAQALFSLHEEADGEGLEGRFTAQFRNVQGAVVSTASGRFVGERMTVEPLNTPE